MSGKWKEFLESAAALWDLDYYRIIWQAQESIKFSYKLKQIKNFIFKFGQFNIAIHRFQY